MAPITLDSLYKKAREAQMLKARAKPQPVAKSTPSIVGEQRAYPSMQVSPTPADPKPVAIKRKQTFPKVPITRPILRREVTTQTASTGPERIPSKLPVMSPKPLTDETTTQTPETVSAGPKTMMQDLLHGSEPDAIPTNVSPLAYSPTQPLTVDAATQTPKPITGSYRALSSTKRQGGAAAAQTPAAVAADLMPVLPNLLQGSEPDMIPIAVLPPALTPALEERPTCTAIAQYHSCGCRAGGTPMFFCTDQYCKHPQPALVAIARLPFSCTTRYSGNARPGMGRGHECRAADPNSVFFTREADTAEAFYADELLVLRGGAVRLRDLPSMLPCQKFWRWAYEVRHRYENEKSRKGDPIACGTMAPPPARTVPNARGETIRAMPQKGQKLQGQSAKQKQQQQSGAQPDEKSGEKKPLQKKPRQRKPRCAET
ncbi:hypothetical protein DL765_005975 [Monosporascus sp. GIB2]|nr:hypothetical protein DL765_005975 [Monosporascus sp. GIB2]